ncbi:unnamed protein product [Zymoseptoria tritici ST99CH_1E4]|uniref:Amine oxidase domain-containing protein n=2 Tax=Zymoseptoria tritici TaxID=1047171 RepID=F9XJH6_ZYMTI|nr:uncharacterized protein MYCGRDRAFT_47119 [Zymoseptoria tritici IPO323]EGP84744.1 hypothetical protein MYCGRDRAFT_47119 [Zymoseptoria tritici IPO323]SMR58396.1 unnamed protein product [Zymoseptoria tritici ST99CH_1E4]
MKYLLFSALQCLLLPAALAQCSDQGETFQRDVVILGGGSSGLYSAVRLQQMGKSVAVVEKQGRPGGNTNTYKDEATGKTFDYGVKVLVNTSLVYNFFTSLEIPLAPLGAVSPATKTVAADFAHGELGPQWPVVNANDSLAALERYKVQLAKYSPEFFRGYHLPDPVPEDLLIPWGEFLAKYDLGPLAYDGFGQFQGMGNILAQPTLYMMKLFNPMQVEAREKKTKVSEANGNTQALWDSAQRYLGEESLILNSKVTSIKRHNDGVEVVVSTPTGTKTIHASILIITVQPKLDLLSPFLDLTDEENQLFGQFNNSYYSNAVIANTGLPENTTIINYDQHATYGLPPLPGIYSVDYQPIQGLRSVQHSSPSPVTDEEIKADILDSVGRVRKALSLPNPEEETEIICFNNHSPSGLAVSVDAIKAGFFKRYVALQGQTRTFWTGQAWTSGSSSTIWDFTEVEVLPAVISALGG